MISEFIFGNPIKTGAIAGTAAVECSNREKINNWLEVSELKEGGLCFSYTMEEQDAVYGLGQNVRGINKRGWLYESKCSDDPHHCEDRHSLYGAHNFLILTGAKGSFGIFVDHPGKVVFDIGYTKQEEMKIQIPNDDAAVYLIEADSLEHIVRDLRRLTGRSYIPPRWAFGYGQSRWSYMSADEVREVAEQHRKNGIPLDSIYLDIDYMERYKDFTIDEKRFPDFQKFTEEMKKEGIHLVPIIDAGVKIEPGYSVYEEGVKQGLFCKTEEGSDFVAGVWPGRVHFPDMLKSEAGKWFGRKYAALLDQGIDGFWNDMNEPAIFYSEEHLNEVLEKTDDFKGKNLDISSFFAFKDLVGGLNNNEEDYKRFFHDYEGKKLRHDQVHNLYGFYMTKAAGEAFEELSPDKRILLFSRSSYIGMHRYGGIWMGDNLSWWSHILLNIHMLPSLNMCGFLYTGADIGGFSEDATEDLVMRWTQLCIFTPLMRNHSAMGTRRQEAYRFQNTEAFRNIISLRYHLLPYLYSEYMKAVLSDGMYCQPLAFVYPKDRMARETEDQLMIGESIMIAPVYEQNKTGRYVYLPEKMKMISFSSFSDRKEQVMEQGHHYISAALHEVVIFIRPNRILPVTAQTVQNVEAIDFRKLQLLGYVETAAEYLYYNDDGYAKDYENTENFSSISLSNDGTLHIVGDCMIEKNGVFL